MKQIPFSPDFRREPKNPSNPYCCVCQKNVDEKTAIAVTVNWESWTFANGHNQFAAVHNSKTSNKVIGNEYMGRDCYANTMKAEAANGSR